MTRVELQKDPNAWALPDAQHLFFDIDDTLNGHRLGLTEELSRWFSSLKDRGYNVVLLTNCSAARAEQHARRLERWPCGAELWPVGGKPDWRWVEQQLTARAWSVEACAMFGDRPTMDLWMAYRLNFSERIWVRAWGVERRYWRPLTWIQGLEWCLLSRHDR